MERHPFTSAAFAVAALSAACSPNETGVSAAGEPPRPPPPAHVIHEQKTHRFVTVDVPRVAEVVTQYRTPFELPDLDVRSLAILGEDTYAGTATGLARWSPGDAAFSAVPVAGSGAVVDLALLNGTKLLLAREDGVEVVEPGAPPGDVWPSAAAGITSVAARGDEVFVGGQEGLSRISAAMESPVAAAQGFAVRDIIVVGDVVWMATAAGVRRYDAANDQLLADVKGADVLPDDDVRAMAAREGGEAVLVATATGLAQGKSDASIWGFTKAGLMGLPTGDLRAIAEANGAMLIGYGIGATAASDAGGYYHTPRWIPAQKVNAVAIGADETRWIGTPSGISRITLEPRALSEKAAIYEAMNEQHWRMDGFVADTIVYADPYDHSAAPERHDHDNDGLWTQMQVAAWCFAYASTGDEAYYQRARKAIDTMLMLFDVPGETFAAAGKARGFITRSLVRDDEGEIFAEKAASDRWHKQDFKGRTYSWKDDTSSDEYVGHFFGIPVFYDLCAKTEDERQAIRERIDLAMSYIVDNGYELIDLDGEPTTHGWWNNLSSAVDGDLGACLASGKLRCVESYGGGGWLNSIEILGHLLAAWHITGDDKYYYEYERLAVDERYVDMIPLTKHTFTVTSRQQANHSDHELASLAYFTLLRYEPDEERRDRWIRSLEDFHDYEVLERNALELAVMASALDIDSRAAAGVQTLTEWPIDLREWLYDNSHRVDAAIDEASDRFDKPQFTTVFPYDEIRTFKWNGNPYAVSGGGNGKEVQAPWPYLLPYWMMRYYGVITAP